MLSAREALIGDIWARFQLFQQKVLYRAFGAVSTRERPERIQIWQKRDMDERGYRPIARVGLRPISGSVNHWERLLSAHPPAQRHIRYARQ